MTSPKPKRTPYTIVIRCTLTGCEWTRVVFHHSPELAEAAMRRGLRHDSKFHPGHSRIITLRPATDDELAAHRAWLASI